MQKQLRIISRKRLAVCPFSKSLSPAPATLSPLAFSKHLGRLAVHYRPLPGVKVFALPCGNFLWRYPSGRRQLSTLPF
jgi:hypothetical protein